MSVLDIGCGRGFDSEPALQREIAEACDVLVGIEPDRQVDIQPVFTCCHRQILEEAAIPPASIDIAFSVMVLEHVREPARHWQVVARALKDSGVFWGFTIDSRHWFAGASKIAGALRLKDLYLTVLYGRRGRDRYENYPTFYRSNTPSQIARSSTLFRSVEVITFRGVGRADYCFPPSLRWLGHALDQTCFAVGGSGPLLAVRAVK